MFLTPIHATVSSNAITKVGRLFNGGVSDVLNELLQNARRACASRIDIETLDLAGHPTLVVRDNGNGIDDPAALLALGYSGWDGETARREDPAGMGMFSLAGNRVEVRSFSRKAGCGWRVVVPPDAWDTGVSLPIEWFDITQGTEILIDLPEAWEPRLEAHVAQCAAHYPLPVHFNGVEMRRTDFLAGAERIELCEGVRIGIFRDRDRSLINAPQINFHGLTVKHKLPDVDEVDRPGRWAARIDIVDAPALQLVLPARKEMVQNSGLHMLAVTVEAAIFRTVAAAGSHRLSFKDWERARDLGVELPPATASLESWTPKNGSYEISPGAQLVHEQMVIVPDYEPFTDHSLHRALTRAGLFEGRLVRAAHEFAGYPWYDAATCISALRFTIEGSSLSCSFSSDEALPEGLSAGRVDSISVLLAVGPEGSPPETHDIYEVQTDLLIEQTAFYCDIDDAAILVTQDSTITPGALACLLDESCFCYDEDSSADSWDSQHRAFEHAAYRAANRLLLTEDEATLERIRAAWCDEIGWLIPHDRAIAIHASTSSLTVAFASIADAEGPTGKAPTSGT